jgi:hypothetical protein
LGAAAQTSVDLSRRARRHLRHAHGSTHVVVGEDVAGTNDHGTKARSLDGLILWIFKTGAGCKRKNRLFKQFQTTALAALQPAIRHPERRGARKMVHRNKSINCNLGRDTAALFIEHSSKI